MSKCYQISLSSHAHSTGWGTHLSSSFWVALLQLGDAEQLPRFGICWFETARSLQKLDSELEIALCQQCMRLVCIQVSSRSRSERSP